METESCKIRGDGVNYVITDRRIKDIGGGIGRDIKYFESRGYKAASELCRIKRT